MNDILAELEANVRKSRCTICGKTGCDMLTGWGKGKDRKLSPFHEKCYGKKELQEAREALVKRARAVCDKCLRVSDYEVCTSCPVFAIKHDKVTTR